MNPREVNFSKFKVTDENILFEDRDFCVAISVYENEYRIGMRWNGEDKNIGYPKSNARPVWFIMHDYLAIDFLKSLIGLKGSNNEKIIKAISNFKIV